MSVFREKAAAVAALSGDEDITFVYDASTRVAATRNGFLGPNKNPMVAAE